MEQIGFILLSVLMTTPFIQGENICIETGSRLDCSNKGLTKIPNLSELSGSVTEIDFSWNKITVVSSLNISNPSAILKLSFSHNYINTFVRGILDPFTKLEELDLSFNQITGSSLYIQTFKYEIGRFESLRKLDLSGNHLGTLERMTFTSFGFTTLEHLDLSLCSLSTVEHMAIDNLFNLKYLDLSYNELTKLDAISLEGLSELETLNISNNKFTVLKEIPRSLALKQIFIDNNLLTKIEENIFSVNLNLKLISLRGNRLRTLHPHILPLESISIADIELGDNPWHCDCNLVWLVKQKEKFAFKNLTLRCGYPSKLRMKNVLDLSNEDLVCSNHYQVLYFLLWFLSSLLGIALIGWFIYTNKTTSLNCSRNLTKANQDIAYSRVNEDDKGSIEIVRENRNTTGDQEVLRKNIITPTASEA